MFLPTVSTIFRIVRAWPFFLLIIGIPADVEIAFLTPLGHSPDEGGHVCRADGLLDGAIIGHRVVQDGHVVAVIPCNTALKEVITLPERPTDPTPEIFTPAMRAHARAITWHKHFTPSANGSISGYFPLFYIPGALAILGTQVLGGSPADAFLSVRLINLAATLALGVAALVITRRAHAAIACTLLLPMTLSIAASCSQNGLLVASPVLPVPA